MPRGPRVRVAVYVTRADRDLLAFTHRDHPDAGLQVPAGGVLPAEDPADAALREVAEETGLTDVTLVRQLGVQHRPHPDTGAPRVTTFWLATTGTTDDRWPHTVDAPGEDGGLVVDCSFLPVTEARGALADGQDEFLDRLPGGAGAARDEFGGPRRSSS